MKIEIEIRNVYGKPTIYPANQAARDLAELVGAKTLQNRHLALAERMGHEIVEAVQPKLAALRA